jgi:diaminopimelate decarboxylase
MDHFTYTQQQLHAENVPIQHIAKAVGTPFYCYSSATLTHHVQVLRESLHAVNPMICFAVKANSNRAVLATLAEAGCGGDVVSEGEARLALSAHMPREKIIFSGVGKTREEMRYALDAGIFQFNVESAPELLALNEVAQSMGITAAIAIRINPDVDAETHAKISTGKKENKFGVDIDIAPELYRTAAQLPGIRIQGISMHIGSQLTSLAPFRAAYMRARELVLALRAEGHTISTVDIGGGLGVPYRDGDIPPPPADYGALVSEIWRGIDAQIIIEPGRLIAGNAGILVSQILYVKESARTYVIIDAGMNDLMRPALYDAHHHVIPVMQHAGATVMADIVGPVCESSDIFAQHFPLNAPKAGDLIAFRTAGAYGASMANTYNSRLLIPEVLVKGEKFAVVRKRPSYDDLLARDTLAEWQA